MLDFQVMSEAGDRWHVNIRTICTLTVAAGRTLQRGAGWHAVPPPLLLFALTATGNKFLRSEAAQKPQQHLIIR